MTLSVALDLGSTRFKAAVLGKDGTLTDQRSLPAPPLTGQGLIREGDPLSYLNAATDLLRDTLSGLDNETPIGLASQRSTFLLWHRETGTPATPLISWQDRRAHDWCSRSRKADSALIRQTGLLLSPHYAGPKLAHLFSTDNTLKREAQSGSLVFGTLETYLLWNWTHGRVHETDLSMAARTLLADPQKGQWSDELLRLFNLPRSLFPKITSTWEKRIPLDFGGVVTATVTDQAASLFSLMDNSRDLLLINLGTGGFALLPTGREMRNVQGYLSGPLSQGPGHEKLFAQEGTINGIAQALAGLHDEEVALSEKDPHPHVFCLPDTSGVGSPYWLADMPFRLSENTKNLNALDQKLAILEGIIFRVCQIAEDLCGKRFPANIFLSGGLANEPFVGQGLASCLGEPIHVLKEKETTLLGAARLAVDRTPWPAPDCKVLTPGNEGKYLRKKFLRWKEWVQKELSAFSVQQDQEDTSL